MALLGLLSALGGTIFGLLLGALPGVHPNLLALLPLPNQALFSLVLAALFSSILPALLMAPSADLAAVLLPGQAMVHQGKMGDAVAEFAGGALLGVALFIILLPLYPYLLNLPQIFSRCFWLPLIIFATIPVLRSGHKKWALIFFLLSGFYGGLILKLPYTSEQILMAHFGGMFGLAGLLRAGRMVGQQVKPPHPRFNLASSLVGTLSGLLISLFPAISPAQASAITFSLLGKPENQLAAAGATATSAFLFCFLSLKHLAKARSAAVQRLGVLQLDLLLPVALLAWLVLLKLAPLLARQLGRHDLRTPMALLLLAVTLVVAREASWLVLPSFLLGTWCSNRKVEKVNLMGSLMVPTIFWYLLGGH